jgi:hypothetical protein
VVSVVHATPVAALPLSSRSASRSRLVDDCRAMPTGRVTVETMPSMSWRKKPFGKVGFRRRCAGDGTEQERGIVSVSKKRQEPTSAFTPSHPTIVGCFD